MTKKVLFIAILISLLGAVSFAEPESAVDQNDVQIKAPVKQQMNRIDRWSNELKAAYEAKDMDKIGELIKQMDKFKAEIHKARAGKNSQDGEKFGKDERKARRAKTVSKGDFDNSRENKSRKQRPMDEYQDDNMDQCRDNDMDQCQDNDMPRHNRRAWKENQYDDDQYQCERPYRQFAQKQGRAMRGQKAWRGNDQRQGSFDCPCCCCMKRGFARRGQWMYYRKDGQQWQGLGRGYQRERFGRGMMDDEDQMEPKQMRRHLQGQNQSQGPRAMQRQGDFRQQRQMERDFDDQSQGQCPMYQRQNRFDRPNYQRKSWDRGDDFDGQGFDRQGGNRKSREAAPSGNEWEW